MQFITSCRSVFCALSIASLSLTTQICAAQTDTTKSQTVSDTNSQTLAERELAFRKKWHIAEDEKVVFKRVPTAAELQEMIALDEKLGKQKHPKKTVSFAEFEKVLAEPKPSFVKLMTNEGSFFIEQSPAEMAERLAQVMPSLKVKRGDDFPKFRLSSTNGKVLDNSFFNERLTLLNFFFDKCAPCIEETPSLNAFSQQHPEIQVLGISFDTETQVINYKEKHGFAWPVAYAAKDLIENGLNLRSYPSYALIDSKGKILAIGGQSELKINFTSLVKNFEDLIARSVEP